MRLSIDLSVPIRGVRGAVTTSVPLSSGRRAVCDSDCWQTLHSASDAAAVTALGVEGIFVGDEHALFEPVSQCVCVCVFVCVLCVLRVVCCVLCVCMCVLCVCSCVCNWGAHR